MSMKVGHSLRRSGRRRPALAHSAAIAVVALALALFASGCGGDDAPSDDEHSPTSGDQGWADTTRPPFRLSQPKWFYRLDLARSEAGTITSTRIEPVELSVYPFPSPSAEYLAIGNAGGDVKSAVSLSFPTNLVRTGTDGAGGRLHEERTVSTSTTTVFLEADRDVDKITVVAPDGTVVLELAPPPLSGGGVGTKSVPIGTTQQAMTSQELSAKYPHIKFLSPGESGAIDANLLDGGEIVERTAEMNDVLANTLAKLSPPLLVSVRTIAVARWPAGNPNNQFLGVALGAELVLRAEAVVASDPETAVTVVHEITHCFGNLSRAVATSSSELPKWPAPAHAKAAEVNRKFRLVSGFEEAWEQLHGTGVEAGRATPYVGDAWRNVSLPDALKGGLASPYGASAAGEDLAEYTGYLITTQGRSDVCSVFAGGPPLTIEVAITYAKLALLVATDLIPQSAFDSCVQGTKLAPNPGIAFSDQKVFSGNLKAGKRQDEGFPTFSFVGAGPDTYLFAVNVTLDSMDQSPLGLHRLDNVMWNKIGRPGLNAAYLANDDEWLARVGEQGFVLITKVGDEGTEGAIFGLVLQNVAGLNTDSFPLVKFRIP